MIAWDGQWYARIATEGYRYNHTAHSSIAFFPAYPLTARLLMGFGLSSSTALLVTSNGCFLLFLLLLWRYFTTRAIRMSDRVGVYSIASIVLWPTAFFFHVAYSESLLVFLSLLALYGMSRGWPLVVIAFTVGLATATRAVGAALVIPLLINICSRVKDRLAATKALEVRQSVVHWNYLWVIIYHGGVLCVALWGLCAFMVFQQLAFHDAVAFANAQVTWSRRNDSTTAFQYIGSLASLEPIWSVYSSQSDHKWNAESPNDPLLNMDFANPILFVGAAVLILVGALKGWLTRDEWMWGVGALAIPYLTQAYRMCMMSHGRFSIVAFPAYIVLGHMLARMPTIAALYLLSISGTMMAVYALLFTSWYPIY